VDLEEASSQSDKRDYRSRYRVVRTPTGCTRYENYTVFELQTSPRVRKSVSPWIHLHCHPRETSRKSRKARGTGLVLQRGIFVPPVIVVETGETGREISLSGMPVNDNGAVNGSSAIIDSLDSPFAANNDLFARTHRALTGFDAVLVDGDRRWKRAIGAP